MARLIRVYLKHVDKGLGILNGRRLRSETRSMTLYHIFVPAR